MKTKIILLFIILFNIGNLQAQNNKKGLEYIIRFDNEKLNKSFYQLENNASMPDSLNYFFKPGALILPDSSSCFKVKHGFEFYNHFSIGFWIENSNIDSLQTLFYQANINDSAKINRLFKIDFNNKKLIVTTKDISLSDTSTQKQVVNLNKFKRNKKNLLFLTYADGELNVYIDSVNIYQKDKVLFNIKSSQQSDTLLIGNSLKRNTNFLGSVGRIFVYNYAISSDTIREIVKSSNKDVFNEIKIKKHKEQSVNIDTNKILAYLSFDKNGYVANSSPLFFKPVGAVNTEGNFIKENSIKIEKDGYMQSNKGIELYNNFTISFFFNAQKSTDGKIIYYQIDEKNKKRFLKLGINKDNIFFEYNDGIANSNISNCYLDDSIKLNTWNHVAYTYQGGRLSFYYNGKKVKETGLFPINIRESQGNDIIYIGKGEYNFENFNGNIDELIIFNNALPETEIEKIYNKEFPALPKISDDIINDIENKFKNHIFKDRVNYIQDTIFVKSNKIELKIWDYDEKDNDSVSVFVNNNFLEKIRMRGFFFKNKIKIDLTEEYNSILFYSVYEGKFGENTLKIKTKYDTKKEIRKIKTTPDTNGVLIFKTEIKNNIILKDTTDLDSITFLIWDKGTIDDDAITILLNKNMVLSKRYIYTNKEDDAFEFKIQLEKNKDNEILIIAADEGRIKPCTVYIKIKELNKTIRPRASKTKNECIIIKQVEKL